MHLNQLYYAKKILIYGYGLEGKSSEQFLREKTKAKISILDENLTNFSKNSDFENYDIIVVSSGISRDKIPRNFWDKCTSNPEIFFDNLDEELREKVIGISGTKGKSTTTKFCAEFLKNAGFKVKIGGNYGIPLLDIYDDFFAGFLSFIIVELSSYQLENLKKSPHLSIFLNFFPDHLDRHGDLENYWNAKSNIWKFQKDGDFLVIPENCRDLAGNISTEAQIITAPRLLSENFAENSVFRAQHWLENFGAVEKLVEILGVKDIDKLLEKTAQNFAGLPHRMEFFTEKNGIKFYDDSLSTNPDSTLASVNFFAKNLGCILLGGQDRKQDFTNLITRLKDLETLVIVLPTESSENLLQTIKEIGLTNFIEIKKWTGFNPVAKKVFAKTSKEKVCLLSCAAPSYDLFKNFIDRGEQWKEAVKNS